MESRDELMQNMMHPVEDDELAAITGGLHGEKCEAITDPYKNYCFWRYQCVNCGNGLMGHVPGCNTFGCCATCKNFVTEQSHSGVKFSCKVGQQPMIWVED